MHRTFTPYHHSAAPLRVVQTSLFFLTATTQFNKKGDEAMLLWNRTYFCVYRWHIFTFVHFLQHTNDSSLAAKEIKSICSFIQQSVHASFETPTGRSLLHYALNVWNFHFHKLSNYQHNVLANYRPNCRLHLVSQTIAQSSDPELICTVAVCSAWSSQTVYVNKIHGRWPWISLWN